MGGCNLITTFLLSLKRGPDGAFSDDDIARVLQDATESPALDSEETLEDVQGGVAEAEEDVGDVEEVGRMVRILRVRKTKVRK